MTANGTFPVDGGAAPRPTMRLPIAVRADHPAFDGHFPGQPVWPGVCLLAEVLEAVLASPSTAALFGCALSRPGKENADHALPTLTAAKFLAPVRPGDTLMLELDETAGGFSFALHQGERCVARGQFARASATAPGAAS